MYAAAGCVSVLPICLLLPAVICKCQGHSSTNQLSFRYYIAGTRLVLCCLCVSCCTYVLLPLLPAVVCRYEGPNSTNPLSFRYYNADEVVLGKKMKEW